MNANELRIGNWIQHKKGDILQMNIYHLSDIIGGTEISEQRHQYNPIPLTQEWLLKFGFEKDEDEEGTWYNQIALYEGNECFNYNASFFEHDNFVSIEYVHQLQNLYYALTGLELTKNSD